MILEPLYRAFARLAGLPDGDIDLTYGATLIAALFAPRRDLSAVQARVDALATAAVPILGTGVGRERALALARWLFLDQGFAGNIVNYYDPRNSFLPDVLERRLGIPITLAVIYLEIAHRVHQPAFGVSLPGHFVIGVPLGGETLYLDPFGGNELSSTELRALAANAVGRPVRLDAYLRPATRRAILTRMLHNLKAIYLARESWDLAARALDWILILAPDSPLDSRDRGLIAWRLGQYGQAIQHFDQFLRVASRGEERERISRLLGSLTN